MRKTSLVLIFCGLAACERPPSSEITAQTPPPASTAPSIPAGSGTNQSPTASISPSQEDGESASVSPSQEDAQEASEEVEAPAQINLDAANAENRLVKAEVLARIDLMPRLNPEEKDKLYVQVERARGMGKIITIPFATGKISVGPGELAALKEKLSLSQIQKFTEDPTVVFVILGFADKKGDEKKNLTISLQRADAVAKTLKDRCAIMNVIHAVGMGSSDIFDAQDFAKNRVVEVWAVLP
jgi:outer membrane protein OmpA-like peptidoglycan-associated protein